MTAAGTILDLSNQTEGFTITGSSGVDTITGGLGDDSISAGAGNDIINGAQNDTLLDGGTNTDTLQVAANFTSTSNAHKPARKPAPSASPPSPGSSAHARSSRPTT